MCIAHVWDANLVMCWCARVVLSVCVCVCVCNDWRIIAVYFAICFISEVKSHTSRHAYSQSGAIGESTGFVGWSGVNDIRFARHSSHTGHVNDDDDDDDGDVAYDDADALFM